MVILIMYDIEACRPNCSRSPLDDFYIFTTGQYQFESEHINFRNITFILTVIIDLVLTAAILRLSDQNICRVNTGVPVDSN